MNYETYLFSCILREHHPFFSKLGYDIQYRIALNLYRDYLNSSHCDPIKQPEECMNGYIKEYSGELPDDEEYLPSITEICKN